MRPAVLLRRVPSPRSCWCAQLVTANSVSDTKASRDIPQPEFCCFETCVAHSVRGDYERISGTIYLLMGQLHFLRDLHYFVLLIPRPVASAVACVRVSDPTSIALRLVENPLRAMVCCY